MAYMSYNYNEASSAFQGLTLCNLACGECAEGMANVSTRWQHELQVQQDYDRRSTRLNQHACKDAQQRTNSGGSMPVVNAACARVMKMPRDLVEWSRIREQNSPPVCFRVQDVVGMRKETALAPNSDLRIHQVRRREHINTTSQLQEAGQLSASSRTKSQWLADCRCRSPSTTLEARQRL